MTDQVYYEYFWLDWPSVRAVRSLIASHVAVMSWSEFTRQSYCEDGACKER